MEKYIDHFNRQTENYRQFRPDYPDALFDFLETQVGQQAVVWDCATGNGQAALSLAKHFSKVIATDINQSQLDQAIANPDIEYRLASAEHSGIKSQSIDLVTVAQALHWFDFPLFYQEVLRVLKPDGWIAAWCYSLGRVNPAVDEIIAKLYYQILGDNYWPMERIYIDEAYKTIPFPFERHPVPEFTIEKSINFSDLMGYLATWSAVKEYERRDDINPLHLIEDELRAAWGIEHIKQTMTWPVYLMLGNRQQYTGFEEKP